MSDRTRDRLYGLLPYVYRFRDAQQGGALRSFLGVVAEQVDVIEDDLQRLYDDWFIETCAPWAVPYLGELLGWQLTARAGEPGQAQRAEGMLLRRTLAPRADVGRALAFARRRGTLPLLEELARTTAGWPAHAVESYRLLSFTQPVNHPQPGRGRTVDLRDVAALERLGGPFESSARTADLRRPTSVHARGKYNLPSVGVYVWSLRAWPVTRCQADLNEGVGRAGRGCYTFDILGRDLPLFVRPEAEPSPYTLSEPRHTPSRLTRSMLERDLLDRDPRTRQDVRRAGSQFYGPGRSFSIELDRGEGYAAVPAEQIVAADLRDWRYRAPAGMVLVDPSRGRFKAAGEVRGARVSWHAGFSAATGGGEYDRELVGPAGAHRCYVVDAGEDARPGSFRSLAEALDAWRADRGAAAGGRAIIEVRSHGAQTGPLRVELDAGETLILRAADRRRPVLRLLDYAPDANDAVLVTGGRGSRFVLDGFLVAGRSLEVRGPLAQVVVRHCTLVPPHRHGGPREGGPAASLVLDGVEGDVLVERSIVGPVVVTGGDEPPAVELSGCVVDAGHDDDDAVHDGASSFARATLTVRETTVLGRVTAHALARAENSIFSGAMRVARRQGGCVRFSYVPPGSRTPRRFHCQPDLALAAAAGAGDAYRASEADRVRPVWASRSYGDPDYARLWRGGASEVARGAEDQGEMGVFHDLYLPQREEALAARLAEYVPAGTEAGIFFAT